MVLPRQVPPMRKSTRKRHSIQMLHVYQMDLWDRGMLDMKLRSLMMARVRALLLQALQLYMQHVTMLHATMLPWKPRKNKI